MKNTKVKKFVCFLVMAMILTYTVLSASCGAQAKDFNGTYKNTDTSYMSGDSYIKVSNTAFGDSETTASGNCECHNVYGMKSTYFDKTLNFKITDSTSATITDPNNANTYWTGSFNESTKTITVNSNPNTYSYKKS